MSCTSSEAAFFNYSIFFFSDAYNLKEIFLSIFITQDLNLRLASCEVQRSSSNVNVNFNNKTHHHLETIAMEE